ASVQSQHRRPAAGTPRRGPVFGPEPYLPSPVPRRLQPSARAGGPAVGCLVIPSVVPSGDVPLECSGLRSCANFAGWDGKEAREIVFAQTVCLQSLPMLSIAELQSALQDLLNPSADERLVCGPHYPVGLRVFP